MSRHEKPGRVHVAHSQPPLPLSIKQGGRYPVSLSTPRPIDPQHRPPPTSTPCSDQRVCSRHQRDRANTGKAKRPRDTETHSKDTPGILAAPSHTTTTQRESGGEGFHSHKDDTKQKKDEERPAKPQLLSADRAAWGWGWTHRGQCRQSDGCFLPILFASKSLAGLGLPPDSCFSPHGPSSACLQPAPPLQCEP